MAEVPPTDEGWFALHDFREIDWNAWRDAPVRRREAALEEAKSFIGEAEDIGDGESAIFTIAGHKADLLVLHLRPTLDEVERLERAFEQTTFGGFTEQTTSFVSVTEIGGYTAPEYFEDPESVDTGLRRYMESKKHPSIPEDAYVSFYPMAKRRDPEYNWYDTPLEERAEMMAEHGETGKGYAGTVTQIVTSALGLDDWEWGVTLFGTDAVALKDIVYEMRFDEATAKYGEFGRFYVGRRFPVADLDAYMAGETVPVEADESGETDEAATTGEHPGGHGGHAGDEHEHGEGGHPGGHGEHGAEEGEETDSETPSLRDELADLDVYGGKPHGEDVYALALYSEADPEELADEVYGLRSNFDHYDTHVKTAVYEPRDSGNAAVVSIWETESAADTASGFLSELPGVVGRPGESEDGWGTMGMFYTVDPDHREDFVDVFDDVGEMLGDMDGHRETTLLVNREDETDMFIASQWDSREDAMAFFRSDAFGETVQFGRDILTDRPRHVFLA
ncbi:Chlorite dismutase, heme-binding protein [Halanaeroarchaeum sp. HSR-CO]|uniref:heme-binding protein n=1 Tax=Halanaeroarchaeum sp. HSR-CO TaxID=2866382 RepID=UPI00217D32CA|nr:heme-binding protein [Halanaeroarchaeum sp. HSR-CO]UWG48869.1 Chlorite dismutase, heme-binding protein [Halanaeroarchaeum sp. HSR-CO]